MLSSARLALVAMVAVGCRATGPAAIPGAVVMIPACDDEKVRVGLRDVDLGFALYGTAAGASADSRNGLGQVLREAAHDVMIELVDPGLADPFGAADRKYEDLAGVALCDLPLGRVRIAGQPARVLLSPEASLARERLDAGDRLGRANRQAEARVAYAAGRAVDGSADLGFPLRIANTYLQERRFSEALAQFLEVAARFPWSADAWMGQGVALRGLERSQEAGAALGRALALDPSRPAILSDLGAMSSRFEVVDPVRPPARRGAGTTGAAWRAERRLGVPDRLVRAEARAYAACKDAFRRSAALRKAATGVDLPLWRWTPAEETVCTALWVSTYHQHRNAGRGADDGLDNLVDILQAGFADERALFDIGARAHPLASTLLDPIRRDRLFSFVSQFRVRPRVGANVLFP